jgi:hypothetical protein
VPRRPREQAAHLSFGEVQRLLDAEPATLGNAFIDFFAMHVGPFVEGDLREIRVATARCPVGAGTIASGRPLRRPARLTPAQVGSPVGAPRAGALDHHLPDDLAFRATGVEDDASWSGPTNRGL